MKRKTRWYKLFAAVMIAALFTGAVLPTADPAKVWAQAATSVVLPRPVGESAGLIQLSQVSLATGEAVPVVLPAATAQRQCFDTGRLDDVTAGYGWNPYNYDQPPPAPSGNTFYGSQSANGGLVAEMQVVENFTPPAGMVLATTSFKFFVWKLVGDPSIERLFQIEVIRNGSPTGLGFQTNSHAANEYWQEIELFTDNSGTIALSVRAYGGGQDLLFTDNIRVIRCYDPAPATPTQVPTATATQTQFPTATATNTPLPTATSTQTAIPTATSSPTPSPTQTTLPTATNTPLPTATPLSPLPTISSFLASQDTVAVSSPFTLTWTVDGAARFELRRGGVTGEVLATNGPQWVGSANVVGAMNFVLMAYSADNRPVTRQLSVVAVDPQIAGTEVTSTVEMSTSVLAPGSVSASEELYLPLVRGSGNGNVVPCVAASEASGDQPICPVPGPTLPQCPWPTVLDLQWQTSTGQKIYRCVGWDEVQAAGADQVGEAALAVAMPIVFAAPPTWVVVGAVVLVGGAVVVIYLVAEGELDLVPETSRSLVAAEPWLIEEWYAGSGSTLGTVRESYHQQFFPPASTYGLIPDSFEMGEMVGKFFVTAETLVRAQSLWTIVDPNEQEMRGAAGVIVLKTAGGFVSAFPLFVDDGLPADWETVQKLEPLFAVDQMINPPMAPGTTEEGSVVYIPPAPGTPQLKLGKHSAKPGTIFWTAKLAAWNLLWNYILRNLAAGGDGGGDFDWCGIKKDGERDGKAIYTIALVKYDVRLWFRNIPSWIRYLGLGEGWQQIPGAILAINVKRPTAWWGFVRPATGTTPEAIALPLPGDKPNGIADRLIKRFTEIPCGVIDVIKALTDPGGAVPPGMLPVQ